MALSRSKRSWLASAKRFRFISRKALQDSFQNRISTLKDHIPWLVRNDLWKVWVSCVRVSLCSSWCGKVHCRLNKRRTKCLTWTLTNPSWRPKFGGFMILPMCFKPSRSSAKRTSAQVNPPFSGLASLVWMNSSTRSIQESLWTHSSNPFENPSLTLALILFDQPIVMSQPLITNDLLLKRTHSWLSQVSRCSKHLTSSSKYSWCSSRWSKIKWPCLKRWSLYMK